MNGGKIDGSILAYTIGNNNSLDSNAHSGTPGANIDEFARILLDADLASDGVRNGDSLGSAFIDTLDKLYLGAQGASVQRTENRAAQRAQQNGISPAQVIQNVQQGVTQAMADAASFVQDHPVVSATAGVGLGVATAAGAGIAMGQNMMNGQQAQQA